MKENNILVKLTENNKMQKVSLKENGPFGFFIWALKAEAVILIIFILVTVIYAKIPNENKFYFKYEISRLFFKTHQNEDNIDTGEVLKEALDDNKAIVNEKEKEFIIDLFSTELEENKEYIDIANIKKKLSTYQANSYFTRKANVAGSYNAVFNEIKLYNNNNNVPNDEKFENMTAEEKQIYFHELNHLMTDYSLSSSVKSMSSDIDAKEGIKEDNSNIIGIAYYSYQVNSNNILSELINELYSREYFSSYQDEYDSKSYSDKMPYIYVLSEIIDIDDLRNFKFNDNISIVVDGLLKIDNNRTEAYKLINSINKIDISNDKEAKQDLYEAFSYFYNKKYGKDMSDDISILCYLYNTGILNKEEVLIVQDYLKIKDMSKLQIEEIIPKGYFSSEYKTHHENVIVKYNYNGEKQKEILDVDI